MRKKLLILSIAFAIIPFANLFAYDCEVDGICYNILSEDEVEVTKNPNWYTGDIVIPESIQYDNKTFKVIAIGKNAFMNAAKWKNNPTSVTLPNSIITIGANAFFRCSSLSAIDIPNSVVFIGGDAFYNCSGLTTVTIGNSVDSIASGAFGNCSGITSIIIPDNVRIIGNNAFAGCSALSTLSIGKNAIIDNNAFADCTNLKIVTINCENIKNWFSECYIDELNLGDNVKTIGDDAFYGCYVHVILPNGLTYIGKRAFARCSNTSLYIPKSVTFVGEENFMNCGGIIVDNENPIYDSRDNCNAIIEKGTNTLVTGCSSSFIPESVTSIGKRAFVDCSGLISITIPNSVTKIGAEAFSSTLSSVFLGENVSQIDSSFVNCWVLNKVYCFMEDAPSTIDHAFGAPQNATLYVPENSIDKYKEVSPWNQFREILPLPEKMTTNLSGISYDIDTDNKTATVVAAQNSNYTGRNYYTGDITIPSTIHFYKSICDVTAIGDNAFAGNSISSVSIPNSVKTIGDYAFSGTNLNTLNIPQSVVSIGAQAFKYCKLGAIVVDGSNTVYDSRENCNAIIKTETNELLFGSANTVIPNTVTSIGEYAFSGRSELSSINFPNSITSIGEYAFIECTELSSINLPNSITNIGKNAFYGCSKLTSIDIPNSVNNIGDNPFAGCSSLTTIIVDNNTFYDSRENCNAIINSSTNTLISGCSNTIIPNSITSIGSGAFLGCSNLKSVDIPQKVTTIGDGAFAGCASIEKLSIPNSVTSIGEWAFSSCSSLSSVTLSEGLKTISGSMFNYCLSLTSINIPNNVDSIGYGAFQGCKELTTIFIGDNVKAIGSFAFAGSGVRDLTIGNNVKTIYSCAFVECYNLKQLVIPNSVTNLDGWSFAYCTGLTNVTLGEKVPSINGVFVYCDSILSITSLNPIPPAASWSLPNIDFNQATLSVLTGCKKAYQTAAFWKNFTNIVEIDPSGVQSITSEKDINTCIYDLNGRKLQKPRKGINIIDGKKIIVK